MALVQKNFYGLVKQNGPWAQTVQDKFRTQAPYVYRNNFQTEAPYTVKAGNPAAFESYSSKSIIYNAPITPIVLKKGRIKRGKVERKKIVLIDENGNPTNPSTNNFLNRFTEAAYRENQQAVVESEYGSVSDVSRFNSPRSSITDTTMSSNSRMSVATDSEIAENTEDINFLNLGDEMATPGPIIGEQVVANAPVVGDVEAQGEVNNQHAINEEIRYLLQSSNENTEAGAFTDFVARQDLEDPDEIAAWDREYEARFGENLPQYRRRSSASSASSAPPVYMDIDVDEGPPVYNELDLNPTRSRRRNVNNNSLRRAINSQNLRRLVTQRRRKVNNNLSRRDINSQSLRRLGTQRRRNVNNNSLRRAINSQS